MKNILRNDKGTSLIEVISVLLISTVLIAVSAVGVIAFYNSYNRIDAYVSLQQGVMETLHMMRYGLRMPAGEQQLSSLARYEPGASEYWGISNAGKLEIPGFQPFLGYGNRLKMTPATFQTTASGNDYLEYYLDNGVIRATYVYGGSRVPSPLQIFPKKKDADRVEVTSFKVFDENIGEYFTPIEGKVIALVGLEIEARVLLKDDPLPYRREYETVKYKTTVAKKYSGK